MLDLSPDEQCRKWSFFRNMEIFHLLCAFNYLNFNDIKAWHVNGILSEV